MLEFYLYWNRAESLMVSAIFSLRYKKKCLWCCKGQSEDPEFYFYLLWFCCSTVPLPSVCLLLIWNSVWGNWSHKIECKKWGSTPWNSGLLCKELLFPSIYIFYSMCCKYQVFTNVTRMQTQQSIVILFMANVQLSRPLIMVIAWLMNEYTI